MIPVGHSHLAILIAAAEGAVLPSPQSWCSIRDDTGNREIAGLRKDDHASDLRKIYGSACLHPPSHSEHVFQGPDLSWDAWSAKVSIDA